MQFKKTSVCFLISCVVVSVFFAAPVFSEGTESSDDACACTFSVEKYQYGGGSLIGLVVAEYFYNAECKGERVVQYPIADAKMYRDVHLSLRLAYAQICSDEFPNETKAGIADSVTPWADNRTVITKDNCGAIQLAYENKPSLQQGESFKVSCSYVAGTVIDSGSSDKAGYEAIPFSIPKDEARTALQNITDLPQGEEIPTLIGRIIGWFIAVIGTISLAMFVYAGVNWMVQGGNPEARKKSMQIMVWTVLGVAVIIGSYGIVIWIFNAI